MRNDIDIGKFKIYLPDEVNNQYYIFHDLADLFGKEYQYEAVKILKSELNGLDLKPKPSIDYESDYTSIRTKSPETINQVAQVIDKFAQTSSPHEVNWTSILHQLQNWKRPKPQKWKVGDFLSVQLNDQLFCFAQIVGTHPTIALIDFKSSNEQIDLELLIDKRIITILHLHKMQIQNRTWKVIGNSGSLVADQNEGPWGETDGKIAIKSATGNWLKSVGKVYYDLVIEKKDRYKEVIMNESLIRKIIKYWR